MAKHQEYEAKTEAIALSIASPLSISVVDVEYVKEGSDHYLRVYIDKEGGVTIGDCEAVSRPLSDALDRDDFIKEAYILEVSSPGLGRPLKKDRDYDRNAGKPVELRLFKPVGGLKEIVGDLKSYDDTAVTVEADGKEIRVEKKNISLIREYVNWDEF